MGLGWRLGVQIPGEIWLRWGCLAREEWSCGGWGKEYWMASSGGTSIWYMLLIVYIFTICNSKRFSREIQDPELYAGEAFGLFGCTKPFNPAFTRKNFQECAHFTQKLFDASERHLK